MRMVGLSLNAMRTHSSSESSMGSSMVCALAPIVIVASAKAIVVIMR